MSKDQCVDKKELIEKIKTFLQARKEIRFSYLFGSFIEEDHFRDIDIGIYIDETDPITRNIFYAVELSTRIEIIVKFPVDVIVLNHASSSLIFNASKGELLKNTDDDLRVNFITMHWKMYWDYKWILSYHMEERKHGN